MCAAPTEKASAPDPRDQPTQAGKIPILGDRVEEPPPPPLTLSPPLSSELGSQWGMKSQAPENRVIGDYEILEKIGTGGMGVVYRARQMSLNRIVAFKTIAGRKLTDKKAIQRFDGEARVVATLDHPGIVPVYEIGQEQGRMFFSMEYVDGESLSARLHAGPLSPRKAAEIVATVADAVRHAHENGILHRDLKPSNILIDRQGKPRIIDFGLAVRLSDGSALTTTNAVVGTPNYMSPERAMADLEKVGVACDIYSLGAILYEALVGKPPFVASTPARTMELLVNADLVEPRTINPLVSRKLNAICLRCLAKDPAKRYPSCKQLAEELRLWLEGEGGEEVIDRSALPIQTTTPAAWDRALSVVALLAVFVLASLLFWTTRELAVNKELVRQLLSEQQE